MRRHVHFTIPAHAFEAVTAVALALATYFLIFPLLDPYYLHTFEPDAQSTLDLTAAVVNADAFRGFPQPYKYPPYFDSQYFLYALGAHITRAMIALDLLDAQTLPTPRSVLIFSIRHANLIAFALSAALSYLILHQLSRQRLLSIVLSAYVTLSPHMLGIDLLRVDHVVLSLFLLTFYITLVSIDHPIQRSLYHDLFFGAVTAIALLTKITSAIYVLMPIAAYVVRVRALGLKASGVGYFGIALCLVSIFLMARFIPHEINSPGFIVRIAYSKFTDLQEWAAILPRTPWLYYNVNQFQTYGPVFLSISAVALLYVVGEFAAGNRSFPIAMVLATFVVLSLLGVVAFKYQRGLYVLAPLYLATIACGAHLISTRLSGAAKSRAWRIGVQLAACAVVAVGLIWPLQEYRRVRADSDARAESVRSTRIAALDWLRRELPPNARITVPMHSDWANPPWDDIPYRVAYRFMEFPYLSPDKMAIFRPPSLATVRAETDAIVLNSFHTDFYLQTFAAQGHAEVGKEWEAFFETLRSSFETVRFAAIQPSYGVSWIEVIVVRRP